MKFILRKPNKSSKMQRVELRETSICGSRYFINSKSWSKNKDMSEMHNHLFSYYSIWFHPLIVLGFH